MFCDDTELESVFSVIDLSTVFSLKVLDVVSEELLSTTLLSTALRSLLSYGATEFVDVVLVLELLDELFSVILCVVPTSPTVSFKFFLVVVLPELDDDVFSVSLPEFVTSLVFDDVTAEVSFVFVASVLVEVSEVVDDAITLSFICLSSLLVTSDEAVPDDDVLTVPDLVISLSSFCSDTVLILYGSSKLYSADNALYSLFHGTQYISLTNEAISEGSSIIPMLLANTSTNELVFRLPNLPINKMSRFFGVISIGHS